MPALDNINIKLYVVQPNEAQCVITKPRKFEKKQQHTLLHFVVAVAVLFFSDNLVALTVLLIA